MGGYSATRRVGWLLDGGGGVWFDSSGGRWFSSLSESSAINSSPPLSVDAAAAAASAQTQWVPSLQNPHGSGIRETVSENAGVASGGGFVMYAVVKSVSNSSGKARSTEGVVRVRLGVLLLGDVGLFELILWLLAAGKMDDAAAVMQAQLPVLLQRPQPRGSGLLGREEDILRELRRRSETGGIGVPAQRTFSMSSVQAQLAPHGGVSWPDDGAGEATWVRKLLVVVDRCWCPAWSSRSSSSSFWRDSSLTWHWMFAFASSALLAASC